MGKLKIILTSLLLILFTTSFSTVDKIERSTIAKDTSYIYMNIKASGYTTSDMVILSELYRTVEENKAKNEDLRKEIASVKEANNPSTKVISVLDVNKEFISKALIRKERVERFSAAISVLVVLISIIITVGRISNPKVTYGKIISTIGIILLAGIFLHFTIPKLLLSPTYYAVIDLLFKL